MSKNVNSPVKGNWHGYCLEGQRDTIIRGVSTIRPTTCPDCGSTLGSELTFTRDHGAIPERGQDFSAYYEALKKMAGVCRRT